MRFFCFLLIWLLVSCGQQPEPNPVVVSTAGPAAPVAGGAFLSLGDSYTIGEGVGPAARWSVQLAELLRQNGAKVQNPDIIAQTS